MIRKSLQTILNDFNKIDPLLTKRQRSTIHEKISLGKEDYLIYSQIAGNLHAEMSAFYRAEDGKRYRITIAINPHIEHH